MFCIQCGTVTSEDAEFCGNCGASTQDSVSPAAPAASPDTENVAQVRPWIRYWARMFDIYLASIVAGLAIGILNPGVFHGKDSGQLFGLAVVFAWVFIESLFLSTTGTTPGKWLLKIRLVSSTGAKPGYSAALSRSFKVWWRGFGIGFPIASLITLSVAYRNLTNNGITSWDRDDGFTVVHERIGLPRVLFAIAFFVGFLLLAIVGRVAKA